MNSPIKHLTCTTFIILALAACGEKEAPPAPPTVPAAAIVADAATPVEQKIIAQELTKDYTENKEAANKKYKGKKIEVSGVIKKIEMGISDLPEVVLEITKGSKGEQPRIEFADNQAAKVELLKQGQTIHVICQGDGEVAGMPLLTACMLK